MLEYAMERSLSLAQRRAASTSAEDMLVQEAIHESLHSEHDESARLALFHSELDAAISHSEIDASALERAISDSELVLPIRPETDRFFMLLSFSSDDPENSPSSLCSEEVLLLRPLMRWWWR